MTHSIKMFYFSATDTTKKVVTALAGKLAEYSGGKTVEDMDFTLPDVRKKPVSFAREDIVVVGVPVYAGRVPNVLLKYLNSIEGHGALAVAVVLYGNRHYDDALIELRDILELKGLKVIAGGAFVGEHSFSKILARNRPDAQDMSGVTEFARQIHQKIAAQNISGTVVVPGNQPIRPYYQPRDRNGSPIYIQKVTPKTTSDCKQCKLCAKICPMGSIDFDDTSKLNGICIKCCACVKKCPVGAKYFDDANYLWHQHELEDIFTPIRREPELFL